MADSRVHNASNSVTLMRSRIGCKGSRVRSIGCGTAIGVSCGAAERPVLIPRVRLHKLRGPRNASKIEYARVVGCQVMLMVCSGDMCPGKG